MLPGAGPCDGRLIRAHLIPQGRIRWRFRRGAYRLAGETTWTPVSRHVLVPDLGPGGHSKPLDAVLWDERVWVPMCGGPTGIGGHHGQLDYSGKLRIPRELLPPGLEEFAREHGLVWSLDRDYGGGANAR